MPLELIHVGLMREGITVIEINTALRHAEPDAVRFIGACIDQYRAKLGGRLGATLRRNKSAQPERRQARIGIAQSISCRAAAIPCRNDAQRLRQILDHDLGAQFIDIQPFDQRADPPACDVEKQCAAIGRWGDRDEKIGDDLTLRRQQGAEPGRARRQAEHVGGNQPVEKITSAFAGDFDHAAVGEEGSLHAAHGLSPRRADRKGLALPAVFELR